MKKKSKKFRNLDKKNNNKRGHNNVNTKKI